MSSPTHEDFADAIKKYWHDRPPASLEDVMALYGVFAVAEDDGSLFGSPAVLHDEFVDDGRVVVIHIDLTGGESKVADVTVDALRSNDVSKLAYAHKDSGKGANYSLTQIGSQKGNNTVGVINNILNRIRLWTGYDSVQSAVTDHPDGWIIEFLSEVFEKIAKH